MHFSAEGNATVFIAPFTPGTVSPESSLIRVTDRQSIDEESAWSADGRMLYYVSARDGFRCIYGAGFDPSTKRVTPGAAVRTYRVLRNHRPDRRGRQGRGVSPPHETKLNHEARPKSSPIRA